MRRRYTIEDEKELKEYIKVFTSSTNFIIPNDVDSVDVFVVGGGSNGGVGTCCNGGGYAGKGGEVKTYYDVPVTPGQSVMINICPGNSSSSTYFMNSDYSARGYSNQSGNSGASGIQCPFEDTPSPYNMKMGANGGSGGANWTSLSGYNPGGDYGGGKGGDLGSCSWAPSDPPRGGDGTYYGAGGGGSSERCQTSSSSSGGNGYQGICIIRYYSYE